ncbi:helix-turn-helix domain-containing protein [Sorangium sp. So ce406]|uniref:AraC family transcriptional regulator n=1 Tax=Sorangium sp. So ce406 TaxID=3133311 RepID=UPI003F5B0717
MGGLNASRIGAVIGEAFAVRASTAMTSTLHAEHGAAILVGLDSEVTVTLPGPGGAAVRGRMVVVPPDVWHAASCPGPTLGLLYDPELMPHVAGHARLRGGPCPLDGDLLSRFDGASAAHVASLSRPEVLDGLARELAGWLAAASPRRAPDRRVARVLEALREPAADRRLAIARAGLSEAHLQALFVRDVGLPIRTFQLWRRLLVAVAALSRLDATGAAHAAGFADLAHFSRTCRRMLGYSPTELRSGLLLT